MNTYIALLLVIFASFAYANPVEDTHMVTMRKAELMKIITCVSDSKSAAACEKLVDCNNMMAKQVIVALEKCQKECAGRPLSCYHLPIYPSPEIPSRVFDCINRNTHRLSAEENKKMLEFEECSRKLYADTCKQRKPKYSYY